MKTRAVSKTKNNLEMLNFVSLIIFAIALCIPSISKASTYCPSAGGYISPGMSIAQVQNACGSPTSTTKKQTYASRNIAVKQLIYNIRKAPVILGAGQIRPVVHDGTFSIPLNAPEQVSLMVTIIANKVSSISLNNSSTQGSSLCAGGTIQVGSSLGAVTSACGTPSYVNNSFQRSSQGTTVKEEIWMIKTNEYSPSLRLTFHNGILQSIQK